MAGEITAGDALDASGIDVAAVRAVLPLVEPYTVSIRIAPSWMQRLWVKGISAMTMPWAIYASEAVFVRMRTGSEAHRTGPLVVHELTHLQQYRRLGVFRHVAQYLSDYLRGRLRGRGRWEAYRTVRLEVEAREVAHQFAPSQGPR